MARRAILKYTDDPLKDGMRGWCSSCHIGWTAERIAHCAACCRTFVSDNAFDMHQNVKGGKTVCRSPKKLVNKQGIWTWPGEVKEGTSAPGAQSQGVGGEREAAA